MIFTITVIYNTLSSFKLLFYKFCSDSITPWRKYNSQTRCVFITLLIKIEVDNFKFNVYENIQSV